MCDPIKEAMEHPTVKARCYPAVVLADECARLAACVEELEYRLRNAGIAELSVDNVNLRSYMEHWEGREQDSARLEQENGRLRQIIEDAPHAWNCAGRPMTDTFQGSSTRPFNEEACDCFKSRAQSALAGKGEGCECPRCYNTVTDGACPCTTDFDV